jgi:hypothetical protein
MSTFHINEEWPKKQTPHSTQTKKHNANLRMEKIIRHAEIGVFEGTHHYSNPAARYS